ncbi:hypothetical protein ACO0LO_09085 [Undibacterium sp. TJN25]|uniref:hypothetical protein n=1 Tax=Undibacterium sp. TJN25 TaxID=3413056 RepID=UPI003BF08A9E
MALISLETFRHLNLALTLISVVGVPLLGMRKAGLAVACVVLFIVMLLMFSFGLPAQMPLQQRLLHAVIQTVVDLSLGFASAWLIRVFMRHRNRRAQLQSLQADGDMR